ncbi:MAG TPA: PQQ-binding-like beta-propeller repeat protein, partial [Gemmataceae bacterium]|nr:PQQ-binding-like beta-propeller repeat protein [Gemmataceae bacterium]
RRHTSPLPRSRVGLTIAVTIAVFTTFAIADEPFGWRGDGTGRFPTATPVTTWSETKNIRWTAPVGSGHASPILTDTYVLVLSEPNRLTCLDRKDGKPAWKVAIKPADLADAKSRAAAGEYEPPKDGSGMAAATPVTDGKTVYVVLANGLIAALDLAGKRRWTAYIDAEQNTGFGRSASPILASGKLIVHMTNLYAFDPATGKQLWKNEEAASKYGSPTALKVDGTDIVVTPAGDVVRVSDGKLLTSEVGSANHTSPVAVEGVVQFAETIPVALRFGAKFKEKEIWSSAKIEGEVFGSPLVHDGIVYTVTGKGKLYAWNANAKGEAPPLIDGRSLFDEEEGATPLVYSSVTLAGKHLFVGSNFGETVVLDATRAAKVVARNKLPGGSGASPIFSGRVMFLRDGTKLFCIGP